MQKKNLLAGLTIPLFLLLINFVSAYTYHYDYERALREIGNLVDTPTMILAVVFVLCFFLIFKLFTSFRFGEGNRGLAGVITFIICFFLIWIINRFQITGEIENLWDYFGYSEGTLSIIVPIILLIFVIFLLIKIGYIFFMLSGLAITLLSIFTDYIYEKEIAVVFGIILLLIGLYLWNRKRKIAKGIEPKGIGVGTAIKWLLFIAGVVCLFFNYLLAGIIFVAWLLAMIFFRKRESRYPTGYRRPGFWGRRWQAEKDAWKNRGQRYKEWRTRKIELKKRKRKIRDEEAIRNYEQKRRLKEERRRQKEAEDKQRYEQRQAQKEQERRREKVEEKQAREQEQIQEKKEEGEKWKRVRATKEFAKQKLEERKRKKIMKKEEIARKKAEEEAKRQQLEEKKKKMMRINLLKSKREKEISNK